MIKSFIWIYLLMSPLLSLFPESGRLVPGILKPTAMEIDDNRLYVAEGTSVSIYELQTLKLLAQFGKKGQGPGEFMVQPGEVELTLHANGSDLVVASLDKVSVWTKDGGYKSEFSSAVQRVILPFRLPDGRYLARGFDVVAGERRKLIGLHAADMARNKVLLTVRDEFQGPGKGLRLLDHPFAYAGDDRWIVVSGEGPEQIDVYDSQGVRKRTIDLPQEKRSVPPAYHQQVLNHFKSNPSIAPYLQVLQPITFAECFPPYQALYMDQGFLWVTSFAYNDEPVLCRRYDPSTGKLLGTKKIHLRYETPLIPYKTKLYKGILFQLVETDTEEWRLIQEKL